MYKLCKTEQSASRQRQLEQSLLEMMASKPLADISISDLCDRMNVPRKAFYRYFSGKEGAVQSLIDHTLLDYESYVWDHRSENLGVRHSLEHFFRFWYDHRQFLNALRSNGLITLFVTSALNIAQKEGAMPRKFLPGLEQEEWRYTTLFAVSGLMTVMLAWQEAQFPYSPEEMAKMVSGMMINPLFSQENNKQEAKL